MATTIITPPEPRTLLPPLLACLPTAFVSPHPPPALLSLLSPILRQRVSLLSGNTSSGNGGWLSLLSWDAQRAAKLGKHLEGVQFEAHPVSGELELGDVDTIQFRRLDEETLQTRLQVSEFDLLPVYLWVQNDDQNGGTGPGWKLAELRVLEDKEDGTEWFETAEEANDAVSAPRKAASASFAPAATAQTEDHDNDDDDDDDDDDYWNAYDRTPAMTPANKRSPAPASQPSNLRSSSSTTTNPQIGPTAEELEYFARYAQEVQPALDSHDPDEETPETGTSTLTGDELTRAINPTLNPLYNDFTPPAERGRDGEDEEAADMTAPRARSQSSTSSVNRLERAAAAAEEEKEATAAQTQRQTRGGGNDGGHSSSESETGAALRAETGVKQFIGTEIKSLFRLARSVGMERGDFVEVVERELGVLGMFETDD